MDNNSIEIHILNYIKSIRKVATSSKDKHINKLITLAVILDTLGFLIELK